MQYNVITGYDLPDFIERVEDAMRQGWLLQGGVSMTFINSSDDPFTLFAQALYKVA